MGLLLVVLNEQDSPLAVRGLWIDSGGRIAAKLFFTQLLITESLSFVFCLATEVRRPRSVITIETVQALLIP